MEGPKVGKEFVTVAPESEIPPASARVFEVKGVSLALCNVEGNIYAIDDPSAGRLAGASREVHPCGLGLAWMEMKESLGSGRTQGG